MSKQIVLRAALTGVCALMIGLTGCNNQPPPPAAPAHLSDKAEAVPQSMINEIKHLPPDQQQRALESMSASQKAQVQQALQSGAGSSSAGSTSGGQ